MTTPADANPSSAVVVMGVSGCGKTTVARVLADALDRPFLEADRFHPPANIAKMTAGEPLVDADRWPWLAALNRALRDTPGAVLACSALRRVYREALAEGIAPPPLMVHLAAEYDAILARMQGRQNHFMPPALLRSQFNTLEPLAPDENALILDATLPVAQLVQAVRAALAPQG